MLQFQEDDLIMIKEGNDVLVGKVSSVSGDGNVIMLKDLAALQIMPDPRDNRMAIVCMPTVLHEGEGLYEFHRKGVIRKAGSKIKQIYEDFQLKFRSAQAGIQSPTMEDIKKVSKVTPLQR